MGLWGCWRHANADAAELLPTALPREIGAAIAWRTLRQIDGTFVDESLRHKQSDLLFTAKAAGKPTLLYLLLEHKADEDPWTALQMLRYVVAIWEQYRRDDPSARSVPPVLAVVVHHGSRPWLSHKDAQRVHGSNREQIRRMASAVLTATTLDEVFAS